MSRRLLYRLPVTAILLLLVGRPASAQAPQQTTIFPSGAQLGSTAPVTIEGANLQGATGVLISGQGVTAKITKNDNAGALPVELTVAGNAEPGVREVRVVTPRGTSNAGSISVALSPRILEKEPNNTPSEAMPLDKFPVTIDGQANPAEDVDWFSFNAAEGEAWVFEMDGARHKSPIDGFLALRDAEGHDLATALSVEGHDPRLIYTFPKSGRYFLQVRDLMYRGGSNYTYAVRVGKLPTVVATMPIGGKRGETIEVALEGVNLGDMKTLKIQMPTDPQQETVTVVPMTASGPANPIRLHAGSYPEVTEAEPNDTPAQATKVPAIPATINGRIGQEGDVDVFSFTGQAQQQLVFEVWAKRLGSELDSYLRILDKDGKELSANDDAVGKDSRIAFTLPAAGTYFAEVKSLDRHGGPQFFYRLEIKPPPPPDFSLTVTPDNPNIGPSGSVAMTVTSTRVAYNGEIALRLEGLPAGVTASPATIKTGQNQAIFTLTAAGNAALAATQMRVIGEAMIDGKKVEHAAGPAATIPGENGNPPTQKPVEMEVATVTEQPPYVLDVDPKPLTIKQGQKVEITVRAVRKKGFDAAIPVAVMANTLPAGVTAEVKPIPEKQTEVKFNLVAADGAGTVTQTVVFSGNAGGVAQDTPALALTVAPK